MGTSRLVGVLALVAGSACSPFNNASFSCTSDSQCTGGPGPGTCQQSTGFCSFLDTSCQSGQRYGDLAGSLSNQCVGGNIVDAAMKMDAKPKLDGSGGGSDTLGLTCFGAMTDPARACYATAPTGTVNLSGALDTGSSGMCDTSTVAGACTIAGDTITISAAFNPTGTKPLVLVGVTSITVSALLDISSHSGKAPGFNTAQTGAGAIPTNDTTSCDPGTQPGGHGGGAGGSFGQAGGNGGDPNHGVAGQTKTATTLRGGCYGQNGVSGTPGAGGLGGGVLAMISNGSITIGANIDASGAGGTNGSNNASGGGGGGTGGMIVFDAPTVTNSQSVFANGGAGGGGSSTGGTSGSPGGEANSVNVATGGNGGGGSGGKGGNGGAQMTANGAGQVGVNGSASGGGGGGGVGVIKLFTAATIGGGGMISPNPS
jgi:hypothetical protein